MGRKVTPVHTLKAYEGLAVKLHSFLTLVLDGDEWSGVHPRAGLDTLEKRNIPCCY